MFDTRQSVWQPHVITLLVVGVALLALSWLSKGFFIRIMDARMGPGRFEMFEHTFAQAIQQQDADAYLAHFDPGDPDLLLREQSAFPLLLDGNPPETVEAKVSPYGLGQNTTTLSVNLQAATRAERHQYRTVFTKKEGKWLICSKHPHTPSRLYHLALRTEEVYAAEAFRIDQPDFHLTTQDAVVMPAYTDAGISGLIVLGDGSYRSPDLNNQDTPFEALFLRLNPEDYAGLTQDNALVRTAAEGESLLRAQAVLDEGLRKSFHSNEFVSIPPVGNMSLRMHTQNQGILHYTNSGDGFERVRRPERDSADWHYSLAEVQYRRDELKKAERSLNKALDARDQDGWILSKAHYKLGLVYRDQGKAAKAKEHLEQVIKLDTSERLIQAARHELGIK